MDALIFSCKVIRHDVKNKASFCLYPRLERIQKWFGEFPVVSSDSENSLFVGSRAYVRCKHLCSVSPSMTRDDKKISQKKCWIELVSAAEDCATVHEH